MFDDGSALQKGDPTDANASALLLNLFDDEEPGCMLFIYLLPFWNWRYHPVRTAHFESEMICQEKPG